MKLALCCAAVLLVFGLVLSAADSPLIGTWNWTATPEEGDQVDGALEVKALDGGKLEVVMITHDGSRITTENPKLDGNEFSFNVTVEGNAYEVTVTVNGDKFAGKFTGDAAKGAIEGTKKV